MGVSMKLTICLIGFASEWILICLAWGTIMGGCSVLTSPLLVQRCWDCLSLWCWGWVGCIGWLGVVVGVRGLFRACEGTVFSGPLLSARLCVPICWVQLFCCCWGWVDSSGVDVLVVVRGLVFRLSCGEVLISLRGSMIIVSTWLLMGVISSCLCLGSLSLWLYPAKGGLYWLVLMWILVLLLIPSRVLCVPWGILVGVTPIGKFRAGVVVSKLDPRVPVGA